MVLGYLVDLLLPLSSHGGAGGIPSVRDGVEDSGDAAAGFLRVCRIPPGQDVSQGLRDHPVLIAGHVYDVTPQRLDLRGETAAARHALYTERREKFQPKGSALPQPEFLST